MLNLTQRIQSFKYFLIFFFLFQIITISLFNTEISSLKALIVVDIMMALTYLFLDNEVEKIRKWTLKGVHLKIVERCINLLNIDVEDKRRLNIDNEEPVTEKEKTYVMLKTILDNLNTWSDDKTSRWIGYIQRYLVEQELTTVKAERDFTRPLFHDAYRLLGFTLPKTVSI